MEMIFRGWNSCVDLELIYKKKHSFNEHRAHRSRDLAISGKQAFLSYF